MDFHVTVHKDNGVEESVFEQYQDMLKHLDNTLAYWNNFESHSSLGVSVKKIPSATDTIGVNAADEFKLSDHIR
jgi:hypothetical protein